MRELLSLRSCRCSAIIYVSKIQVANIVLFFHNIIIDPKEKTRYINYRLDYGSQVGNSNSEEFPFYTSKNPEG